MVRPPLALVFATLVVASACGDPAPAPPPDGARAAPPAPEGSPGGRVYERHIVFTTLSQDTTLAVPWVFSAHTRPDGVERRARAWLGRGATWDPFMDTTWTTAATRVPWRLLPTGSLRLMVGEEDAIQSLLFDQGTRSLELAFGEVLIEWTAADGEVMRLLNSSLHLSERRVSGITLDLTRAGPEGAYTSDDWIFLTSGQDLQVVLERPRPDADEAEIPAASDRDGTYRGWGRVANEDLRWSRVTTRWSQVRSFQPARRNVPSEWTLRSSDGGLTGRLTTVAASLEAGESDGPLLPVDGLISVEGTIRVAGTDYPVRGLVRHTRP